MVYHGRIRHWKDHHRGRYHRIPVFRDRRRGWHRHRFRWSPLVHSGQRQRDCPHDHPGAVTEYPGPTASAQPSGIAAGPDGALWFTEWGANKIGRITTAGVITEYNLPSTYNTPTVITAGPDGALWFIYNYNYAIGRITTAGAVTEYSLPYTLGSPLSIASGPDGALWFPTNVVPGLVGRITTSGSVSQYAAPGSLGWIASGPDGALWLTDYSGRIGRLTTSGVFTEYPMPTPSAAGGIVKGPDGALWFTEENAQPDGKIGRASACGLGLNLTYADRTLTMNFDLSVMTPATWSSWLISGSSATQLWSKSIAATHPPRPIAITHIVGAEGNVGVLSVLTTAAKGMLCTGMQVVDTTGTGATVEQIRSIASGLLR